MYRQCRLNPVSRRYLSAFYCILNDMVRGMTEADRTNSISRNFIVQMIPHHQAAIDMSQNILKYTTNEPLRDIASGIISEQTKSIQDMRSIECLCGTFVNSERDLCQYQRELCRIMQSMFCKMRGARATNRNNCNFMWEMIPHHQGAIAMSKLTLTYEICSELKPILEAIIASQEKGVAQMKRLLCCIGC